MLFGQEMGILGKNLVSMLVSKLSREVSVTVWVSNFGHRQYRYQYRYRKFRPGEYHYQYRYRVFDPRQYQYRIGIKKIGIEGLCWAEQASESVHYDWKHLWVDNKYKREN